MIGGEKRRVMDGEHVSLRRRGGDFARAFFP